MLIPAPGPPLLAAFLFQAALCLAAATNFSIDDQNPLFQYSSGWITTIANVNSSGFNMDIDGGHHLTVTLGSSATITYTFATVYFLSARWPYPVATDYGIDGNTPLTIDMQDHTVPATGPGGVATVASGVVGQWTSTANQEHTIHITIPPADGEYAIVDMFIFEVLDSSNSTTSSSTISSESASQTSLSSSTGTTSGTSSSSSSSGSQGPSSTVERNLAISMGVVGTLLAFLVVFLLWWFCIRRKGRNDSGNKDSITPQYDPVPTFSGNASYAAHVPLNDNSKSMRSDSTTYGLGMQNDDIKQPPTILSYDRGTLSYSGLPPTLYTNQSASSLPHTQKTHLNHQGSISSSSMMTDIPPMYRRSPVLDESTPVSSSNDNTNEKSGRSLRIPVNTLFPVPETEDELPSTAIPARHEENVSVWDSGYPQPLRFIPIG